MFIVSNESSIGRPVELESPTSDTVRISEVVDGPFSLLLPSFSSGARAVSRPVDVNGREHRRDRLEGQREDESHMQDHVGYNGGI